MAPNWVCHIHLCDEASGNNESEQSTLTFRDYTLIDTLAGAHVKWWLLISVPMMNVMNDNDALKCDSAFIVF